ncbi:MAG: hypothetical protein ACI84O_001638 [Myxococcota bacterium]|jgi:hypothetical protein
MEIKNTSKAPLKVPLSAGKTIFLGPGATGKVNDKVADYPPFQEMVENGAIEVLGSGRSKASGSSTARNGVAGSNTGKNGGTPMRKSGDR